MPRHQKKLHPTIFFFVLFCFVCEVWFLFSKKNMSSFSLDDTFFLACGCGKIEDVKKLLKNPKLNINYQRPDVSTLFFVFICFVLFCFVLFCSEFILFFFPFLFLFFFRMEQLPYLLPPNKATLRLYKYYYLQKRMLISP